MGKNQRTLLRRLMPTAHKILLDRLVEPRLRLLSGDVLIVGAGREPYKTLIPKARTICNSDIDLHEGIDMVVDAHSLPMSHETFDSVVAIEVFEHLREPSLAASELFRVLRPSGVALISVPFLFRVHGDPHDYHRFTKSGLEELFKEFSSVKVLGFGNRLQVISDLLTTIAKPAVVFRVFNHLITMAPFTSRSHDCPSGYIIELGVASPMITFPLGDRRSLWQDRC